MSNPFHHDVMAHLDTITMAGKQRHELHTATRAILRERNMQGRMIHDRADLQAALETHFGVTA